MATYQSFGPFEIPCKQLKKVRNIPMKWPEEWNDGLLAEFKNRKGCYVYAIKAGKGVRPWYAGKTTTAFKSEAFTADKVVRYNEVLSDLKRGKPVMYFVSPDKGSSQKIIDALEKYLIYFVYRKNPQAKQIQHVDWSVAFSDEFKKALGIEDNFLNGRKSR